MNVSRIIAAITAVNIVLLSYTVSSAASLTENGIRPKTEWDNLSFDRAFELKLQDVTGPINAQLTAEVKRRIKQYLRNKSRTEEILSRKDLYFPIFDHILSDRALPKEIKNLSIVESALNPRARSGVGAVGLWQLMKSTGRMLGLSINRTLDHRRDPFRSTEAAFSYLEQLHKEFKDWTLAIAAYNSGPGRVRKAVRRSGSRDFWKLKRFLPKETRDYVPAFIAVSYVLEYYKLHGLEPKLIDDNLRITSVVKVYDYLSFKELSAKVNISISTIQMLNPAYLRAYIPKYSNGNYLVLPAMAMNRYLELLWEENTDLTHKVEMVQIQALEDFKTLRKINEVQTLDRHQPYSILRLNLSDIPKLTGLIPRNRFYNKPVRYYRLKPRESLMDIARSKKNITVEEILEWNGLSPDNPPKPGMLIKIYEE